jgi:hypothetical protein
MTVRVKKLGGRHEAEGRSVLFSRWHLALISTSAPLRELKIFIRFCAVARYKGRVNFGLRFNETIETGKKR